MRKGIRTNPNDEQPNDEQPRGREMRLGR